MSSPYETSPTNLRSLRDRLAMAAKREGVVFGRLQRHVGVLVVAQFMTPLTDDQNAPLLLIKGGVSLELRRGIPQSRTSKDLDAVIRCDIDQVYDRLVQAGADGWEGFTAVFTSPAPFEVPGLASSPYRFAAKIRYRGKPFVSIPIEVSPVEAGNADGCDKVPSDALALVGLPASADVPCMTLPWPVAQKLHACTASFEKPRTNDRAHDIVDLQILEALIADQSLAATRSACVAVFTARAKHDWPPVIAAQPHWGPIYALALEGLDGLGLLPAVDDAVRRVQAFIARINKDAE